MMNFIVRRLSRLPAAIAVLALLSACASDKLVYRTQSTPTPPADAAGFVGYADTTTGQTVCGACHVDKQNEWAQTHHAHAWTDLQASGHAQASCDACHTVDSYGNATTDTLVGFLATHDARYHDVQCENCHGPGLTHVTSPTIANEPLASLAADTGGVLNGVACGQCHTGINNPQTDNWVQSAHANSIPTTHIIGNAACEGCHVGQYALQAWGMQTNYIEASAGTTSPLSVTCAVCHDPHGGPNAYQLRYPIDVRDTSQMLCMRCHQRDAKASAPYGGHPPMAPEGPILLGYAGWFPPGYTGPDTISDTHGSAANTNLCVTCHMPQDRVTNASGALVANYGGHLFIAAPCLNSDSVPTAGTCDITQRSFAACAQSGCHGTPAAAMSAMTAATSRLALLDSALSSQLARLPDSLFSSDTVNTAIGAQFDLQLAEKTGSEVHNPFLMETLLTASITQVQQDYGIAPAFAVDLTDELRGEAGKFR